jgi:two-component system sensor histidine kinase KdpD
VSGVVRCHRRPQTKKQRAGLCGTSGTPRASEEANDMKVRFLAMVSHELRTPLTSIKGFTSTLLAPDIDWDVDKHREYLAIIDEEAEKLTELIEQLMDISRLQAGAMPIDMQPHHLTDIISSAATQLEATLQDHQLAIDISRNVPQVLADKRRIEQVIVNLVHNAVKYSPEGSEINLKAYRHTEGLIEIDVQDRGVGIPPDQRERVFEPFHQVAKGTNSQKGAGLGLAICKGLVEAHGGRIWIQNQNNSGTTISFTLPVVP